MENTALRSTRELIRQGALEQAEKDLRHLIQGNSGDAEAHELLGMVYLSQQRLELAISASAAAVELDPARENAWRSLARAQDLLGRRDDAISTLRAAIDHQPSGLGCYADAALLLRDGGDIPGALALLDLARRRLPAWRWEAERFQLDVLMFAQRFAAAAEAARNLLEQQPDDVSALDYLATACYQTGDLTGAIEAAQRLSSVAAEVPEYTLRLAALLREAGQTVRAVALYQHVADSVGDAENVEAAREALRALDALQLPVMLMLATESRGFLRELREDAAPAMLRHGFALSRDGLAGFLSLIHDLTPSGASDIRLH